MDDVSAMVLNSDPKSSIRIFRCFKQGLSVKLWRGLIQND